MPDENDFDLKARPAKLIEVRSTSETLADESSASSDPSPEKLEATSPSPKLLVGQIIGGHYEILCVLGEGGISIVYKARHVILGTPVAIKFLLPGTEMDAKAIMRFQREAQTTAELKHSSIAGIREFGIHQAIPYLVLEFVEGRSLADIIKSEGKLEPQRALGLLQQAAAALAFAHENKVVHRDIKPSNLMVCSTKDGKETIKIIDFGIAKVLEGDDQRNLTKTGDVFGTPSYMSPEQCRGRTVDYRTDVYSLGCVAYEMFGGTPPFTGEKPIEVIFKHLDSKHKHLKPIKEMNGLNQVIDAALAKDPKHRYQTCNQFLQDLNLLAEKKQPVGKPLPVGKIKTKRLLITMTILLLGFLALYLWFLSTFRAATIETLNETIAKNPGMADSYVNRSRFYYRQGEYEKALADTKKALELEPKDFWAHKIRCETFTNLGNFKAAREEGTRAIAADPQNHRGYLCRGTALYYLGLYDEAIKDLNKSLETNHEFNVNNVGNNRSISSYYLACCLNALEQYEKALENIDNAIKTIPARASVGMTDQDAYYIQLLTERAKANLGLKRFDAAIRDAQAAIDIDPADAAAKQVLGDVRKAKQSQ